MNVVNYCPNCGSERIFICTDGDYVCQDCGIEFVVEIKE